MFSKKYCWPTYSAGRSKSTVPTRCDIALYKKGISSTGACRANSIFYTQLGSNYSRPMGFTDNKRFAPSIHCDSSTGSSSGGNAFPDGARDVNLSGSTGPRSEGGYLLAKRPSGGPTISGPQKGWWVSPSSKLEGPEQVHPRGALQDGGVPHGERSGEAGGLVSKDRFEGCLFPNHGASLSPEVSPVYLEGKSVPVPMSSIRTLMCSPSVYESNEASSCLSQRKGNQIDNLFGRPTDYLQQYRDPVSPNQLNPRFVPDSRSGHQRDKISDDTYPGDCVLGFSSFNSKNDHLSPSGKNEENQAGCSSSAAETPSVDTGNGHLCGKDHSSQSSNQGSSSIPLSASSTDKQCNFTGTIKSRSATGLPSERNLDHRDKGRVAMVGSRSISPQSNASGNSAARYDNRDRCLSSRLGCPTSGVPDRGTMVNTRETDAYQCVRAAGSISCPKDLCQRQITFKCASSNGQHVSQSLHKPFGGHTLPSVKLTGSSDVEMVPGSPHFPYSRTPARQGESDSRRGIQGSERSLRLDDTSKSFFPDTASDGSPRGGPFCISPDTLTTTFFQLETGSPGRSHGCIHSGVESVSRICESSVVPHFEDIIQDTKGGSQGIVNCSSVEDSAMVSSITAAVGQDTSFATRRQGNGNITNTEGFHNANGSASVSRMAIVRQKCRSGGLSEGASDLLSASWRGKTTTSYESLFKRWDSWCKERDRDPIRGPVADVANFLAQLFEEGYQYRSLNAYRSAIGSVHEKIDGIEVGKHPLIARILKGVFNKRPPRSKYNSVWDVYQVLAWLKSIGPSDSLSLRDLTIKTTMLLALTRPCRGADLRSSFRSN